jgi:hypothetical protein
MSDLNDNIPWSSQNEQDNIRQSRCYDAPSGSYRLVFPYFEAEYGWEFNRENMYFETVDSTGSLMDREMREFGLKTLMGKPDEMEIKDVQEEGEVYPILQEAGKILTKAKLPSLAKFLGAKEEEADSELQAVEAKFERHDAWYNACVDGNTHDLHRLLQEYPYDHLLMWSENGQDAVHLVVHLGDLETLKWLHSNGVPIDNQDWYGRMPIMEAALRGRLDMVQYLVE